MGAEKAQISRGQFRLSSIEHLEHLLNRLLEQRNSEKPMSKAEFSRMCEYMRWFMPEELFRQYDKFRYLDSRAKERVLSRDVDITEYHEEWKRFNESFNQWVMSFGSQGIKIARVRRGSGSSKSREGMLYLEVKTPDERPRLDRIETDPKHILDWQFNSTRFCPLTEALMPQSKNNWNVFCNHFGSPRLSNIDKI